MFIYSLKTYWYVKIPNINNNVHKLFIRLEFTF